MKLHFLGHPFLPKLHVACVAAIALAPAASAGPPHVQRDARGRITHLPAAGVGLGGIAYWQPTWPFADGMKAAGVAGRDTAADKLWLRADNALPYPAFDRDGYPTEALAEGQSLQTNVFVHAEGRYPAGTWVLRWDGTGEMSVGGDARGRSDTGRVEATVPEGGQSNGGMTLHLHATDPADPVRNIRFWTPGNEGAQNPIHPDYAAHFEPFSVARMMDWGETNLNPMTAWDQRPLPSRASWSSGVPYEIMVRAANELDQDLWLCVPHRVVDGDPSTRDPFVTRLAQLVRFGADAEGEPYATAQEDPVFPPLEEELNVWLEYSNETWNGGFKERDKGADPLNGQFTFIQERAEAAGERSHATHARYSSDLFRSFEEAFGRPDRLIRVMASQAAAPHTLRERLAALPPAGEPGSADVATTTHYFTSLQNAQAVNAWLHEHGGSFGEAGMEEVFAGIHRHIDNVFRAANRENAAIAAEYGVPLVSYEGNQHLTVDQGRSQRKGNVHTEAHPKLEETLAEVCRSERMHDAYQEAMRVWADAGGRTPTIFVGIGRWGRSGMWGHREFQGQSVEEATLWRAFTGWLEGHADGWDVPAGR